MKSNKFLCQVAQFAFLFSVVSCVANPAAGPKENIVWQIKVLPTNGAKYIHVKPINSLNTPPPQWAEDFLWRRGDQSVYPPGGMTNGGYHLQLKLEIKTLGTGPLKACIMVDGRPIRYLNDLPEDEVLVNYFEAEDDRCKT